MGRVLPSVSCPKITNLSVAQIKGTLYVQINCRLLLVNTNRAPKRGVAIYRSKSLNAAECEELNSSVFQESVWCNFTSTNEEKVLNGRIYKSPNSTEKNTQELLKLMKSDLLNNYDKIYIVGDFNYPSIRWDAQWSNNKDNEFVEYVRSVFLTQMVKRRRRERKRKEKKKLGREKDIPLICLA